MNKQRRRSWSVAALVVLAVIAGCSSGFVASVSRPEAVRHFQATATFADDGNAVVDESILYHFDEKRHGIYRVLPDVPHSAAGRVKATSDNTDQFTIMGEGTGLRLKIGDPGTEITGDHRYEISYPLSTADMGEGRFGWNGVGTSWDVPIDQVELALIAPWRWEDATCNIGTSGSIDDCTVTQPVPGRLEVHHGRLDSGEGITVYAQRGAALTAAPETSSVPAEAAPLKWSQRPVVLAVVGALGVVVAGLIVAGFFRRAGRDWVMAGPASTGAAADLAFSAPVTAGVPSGATRVDDTELAQWATTEFVPPRGLAAWQGGVLATESTDTRDSVAWLLGAAENGQVEIDEADPKAPVLRRVESAADPEIVALLEVAFAGRESITLGTYDKDFTSMWSSLPAKMRQWYTTSGFADPVGERRARIGRVLGSIGLVLGGVVTVVAANASSSHALWGIIGVGLGTLVVGAALGALLRAWELHVRTPAGSALWLRVESFRRFLAASEAEHVRQAAERGVLREYTAWAIALDEVDHWTAAVERAGLEPSTPGLSTVLVAGSLSSSMSSAGTAPSSSSGGGGGVGGGGGGGGGGSW
ncbi:MAG TPA: DUF2207 domain-containing protein [Acidimicrobiales bacterium]|nr:DUF2207 domain-containing protein [Acidimicrobiales bacterium]